MEKTIHKDRVTSPEGLAPASQESSSTQTSDQTSIQPDARNKIGSFPTFSDLFFLFGFVVGAQIFSAKMLNALFAGLLPDDLLLFLSYTIAMGLTVATTLAFRKARRAKASAIAFQITSNTFSLVFWGFIALLSLAVVLEPIQRLLPPIPQLIPVSIWGFLSAVIAAPILEEYLCRGIILRSLQDSYSPTKALIVSSIFFGLIHLEPAAIVYATGTGLILGWVTIKSHSIGASILIHMMNNLLNFGALIYLPNTSFLSDWIPHQAIYWSVIAGGVLLLALSLKKLLKTTQNK